MVTIFVVSDENGIPLKAFHTLEAAETFSKNQEEDIQKRQDVQTEYLIDEVELVED